MKRVVVTGIGLHTPLGDDLSTVFDALLANETGVVPMPEWTEYDGLRSHVAAPVRDFDGKHIPRKSRRSMGRVAMLAASAAELAAADAGLSRELLQSGRAAVAMGSTAGSSHAMERFYETMLVDKSATAVLGTSFFQVMAHTTAANVALHLKLKGEVWSTNSACASSSQAIGLGLDRIRLGRADVVLCGGAEELHLTSPLVFQAVGAATTRWGLDADSASRPFDVDRDGIVVGEGAAVLVLEEREHALARGATILAEVLGHGTTCDGAHIAAADVEGMTRAIQLCLEDADCEPSQVDYINAHATGTMGGDAVEAEALYGIFGDSVPVSSSKGHLGHTLGACGAVESAICIEAMRRGIAPGTRNLTQSTVAPIRVLDGPLNIALSRVLNTNFAFGGVNSVLLFGRVND